MKKELKFTIKNKIDDLEQMNFTVKGFLEACDIIEQTIFKVNLILEELITNIIKYGLSGKDSKHDISIFISIEKENQIYIKIEDFGDEFNPLYAPTPEMDLPIEDMKIGGLGLHLVKNIISDIDYQRTDNKNIQQIWLKKYQKNIPSDNSSATLLFPRYTAIDLANSKETPGPFPVITFPSISTLFPV